MGSVALHVFFALHGHGRCHPFICMYECFPILEKTHRVCHARRPWFGLRCGIVGKVLWSVLGVGPVC